MSDSIRFAVLGAGNIGATHAAAIEAASNAQLVAVWNRSLPRAREVAEQWGVEASDDLEALLGREDIDAVTIATPSGAHLEVARPAAEAGKHILCEKPLEVTSARARELIDVCESSGVELACVFQSRLNRHVQRIRQALDEGRFGELVLASMQLRWWRDRAYYEDVGWRGTWKLDGGGALMNQGIHFVDLLCYLAGDAAQVQAFTARRAHSYIEVEDTAAVVLRFEGGGLGTIEASTACAPGFSRRLELSGTQGTAALEENRLVTWRFTEDRPEDEAIRQEGQAGDGPRSGSSAPQVSHEGHLRLVEDLAEAIRHGRRPAIPGREGLRAVQLIERIYAAAESGQPVGGGEVAKW